MAKREAASGALEFPYDGGWDGAVKRGDVSDALDTAHPIATRAVGNLAPVYVTRRWAEARLRVVNMPYTDRGFGKVDPLSGTLARLDAGEVVHGPTAAYWRPDLNETGWKSEPSTGGWPA